MNPDDKPFEMQSQEPQDIGDNVPIVVPPADQGETAPTAPGAKADRAVWYFVGGASLIVICVGFLLVYTFLRTNPFQNLIVNAPPTLFPTSAPNFPPNPTATRRAPVRPLGPPTLGTANEARDAVEADTVKYLESVASIMPGMPDINQPGDVYTYEIFLQEDEPLLWDYGWCATTPEILDENMAKMQIVFKLDGETVSESNIAVTDGQETMIDGSDGYCRTYSVLIKNWTEGDHQLETLVTFTQPTNDGWNLYPAGTHTFKYFVTVIFR